MENPIEILLPGRNRVLVVFGVEKARNWVTLALLDHLLLDLRHRPAITYIVSDASELPTTRSTHVVNWFIAWRTD